MFWYSVLASKEGHALATPAKSLCPCIIALGNFCFNSVNIWS
jgi:hypothetical protein